MAPKGAKNHPVITVREKIWHPPCEITGEQKIRMSKVEIKVSGCFRTERYAHAWCRISSYLDTMAELEAILIALDGNAADMTSNMIGPRNGVSSVNRHSTVTHYPRPTVTHLQEGGTGGEESEILFFSAKWKRRPSLSYSMQIIPVCLSIVARRKGVSTTRRGGSNWTPISLLVGHPCKLFHSEQLPKLFHI